MATGAAEQARPVFAEQLSPLEIAVSVSAVRQADRNINHRSCERAGNAIVQVGKELDPLDSVLTEPDGYPAFCVTVEPDEHRLT